MVTEETHRGSGSSVREGNERLRRVALVSEPGCDGVFRYVEALARYMMAEGVEVELAYSDRRKCDDLYRLVEDIEAAGGHTLNLRVGNAPEPRDALATIALYRFLRQTQAQVVHAHSSKAGGLARLLRVLGFSKPIFYSPHAYYGLQPRGRFKTAFYNGIERVLGPFGHTVHTSGSESDFALQQLRLSPLKCSTRTNGVDVDRFTAPTPEQRLEARQALGLPRDALVLGTIARVSEQKDPVTLYKAFSRAARTRKDLILYHLGGTGDERLETEVTRIVQSHGLESRVVREQFRSNTAQVYHALDALILPSLYEGLSLVLLEALASNLPLLLSVVPGNIDLRDKDLNRTWWVKAGDVGGFAQAIEDWSSTVRTGCNHREVAIAQYSQRACFGGVHDSYRASYEQWENRTFRLLPYPRKTSSLA